MEVLPSQ